MRVVQLGPYPPPHGGVQTNLVAIRRYLRAQGIPCAAINITRHRREDADEVYYPKTAIDLVRLLFRLPFNVLHLHLGGDLTNRLLALSLVCCAVPGAKAVLTFHSGGYPSSPAGQSTHPRTFRAFVLRRFAGVIAVNPQIADFFRQCGIPEQRIRTIVPFVADAAQESASLPEPLESFFASHRHILLTVGLLEAEYDLPLQINALGPLRERYPDAGLVIIGSGSLEPSLRELIASKPYAPHVLLCGDVPHEHTLTALRRCTVFLRTTLYDGDSISVREALHMGTPVIATDNAMRPPGCHLIPASQQDALLQAIATHLDQPPRPRQSQAADADDNLRAVLDFYRQLYG